MADNTVKYRHDRPILIISSTSWTADEDFSILLKAAQMCDKVEDETFPKLLFVITGKGPLKEKYEKEISKMSMRRVRIITMWLSAEDYPLLLGIILNQRVCSMLCSDNDEETDIVIIRFG